MMNGKNRYICDFCKGVCYRSPHRLDKNEYGKGAFWHFCYPCDVRYGVTPKGIVKLKVFSCPKEKDFYQFRVDYKRARSEIGFYHSDDPYNSYYKALLEFDYIVHDITPKNMLNKIKTYILFS